MTDTRLIDGAPQTDDERIAKKIRPKSLNDYIGQSAVREQMDIFMQAARGRNEAMALRVAQAYETATTWHQKQPDLSWADS